MKVTNARWLEGVLLMSALAVSAAAQTPGPVTVRPGFRPVGSRRGMMGRPGPMGGVFSFVEPIGENSSVVQGAPFSAQVVRESTQQLPDGNVIDRKSTGMIARDAQGRTRREMTLENIGPLAAAGKVPRLVFISDPVAGKLYTLNEDNRTVVEMSSGKANSWRTDQMEEESQAKFQSETTSESLGEKMMDGVVVQGTRITRTIPAGQIGNEKPIVITTERWYSPDLQTVVQLQRKDPRFGTTTYELTNIRRSNPSRSLFSVPLGFRITKGGRFLRRMVGAGGGNPRPPLH